MAQKNLFGPEINSNEMWVWVRRWRNLGYLVRCSRVESRLAPLGIKETQ